MDHLLYGVYDIALITGLCMTMVFILSISRKDNSIVDIFWGLGFVIIAVYSLIQSGEADLRKLLFNSLVVIWGLRLAIHILSRSRNRGEDFRYKAWRNTWKYFYLRSFFQIYMLQGLLMVIISFPVWFVNFGPSVPFGLSDTFGLMIFGTGFMVEAIADQQLSDFRRNPANRGKIITTGLWSISRHPNYFGESLVWWGLFLYAAGMPGGWFAIVSPVVITLLLRFVSGVPMLEKKYEGRKDWEEYKAKTSPFFPFIGF